MASSTLPAIGYVGRSTDPSEDVPSSAPFYTDAALSFNSRTNIPVTSNPAEEVQFTLQEEQVASSSSSVHSYPPTPTAVVNVIPPTPNDVPGSSKSPPRKPLRAPPMVSSQITQFVLAPSSIQPAQQLVNASFLARAFSALKSQRPSHSNSFTLSRLLPPNPQSPPPPYASRISVVTEAAQSTTAIVPEQPPQPLLHTPLLVFHDQTPVLTVRSLTGLIELDQAEERLLGVDTAFWIAVALTYLEFLEERESYLAALAD
ncbi:hypothetical protein NLJ89_g10774 [Agrocybe chaxingu]|uniref:Uncharacterized protein n=1 Tax=Agrocybe chaxingu TaxID=84603 RepID=A0A9W8JTM6_9AGAR|nr:hypothetical protein NLJ89_g10774 [Agrocybe chaxingu]